MSKSKYLSLLVLLLLAATIGAVTAWTQCSTQYASGVALSPLDCIELEPCSGGWKDCTYYGCPTPMEGVVACYCLYGPASQTGSGCSWWGCWLATCKPCGWWKCDTIPARNEK